MNVLAVIQDTHSRVFNQCRCLLSLNGWTFLEEILSRLSEVPAVEKVTLITSTAADDDILAERAQALGVDVYRGAPRDVLRRTLAPIDRHKPEHVLRISGSSPLVDPDSLTRMINLHLASGADLTTCECRGSVVQGLGAEVVRAATLRAIDRLPLTNFQREFHTQYLKQNRDRFRVEKYSSELSRPAYSLSVGGRRDYVLVKEVVKRLGHHARERDIVQLLDQNPHMVEINTDSERPREIGLDKLMLFPDKLREVARVANGEIPLDETYPVSVELSLTDACNLSCIWCSDLQLRTREHSTMRLETVRALVDDLHAGGVRGVVLEGGGEPTLHPDFEEIVDCIHAKGMGIGLITNGVRPLPRRVIEKFEWVRVSLDASSPQEFLELKKLDAFDQVIDNINAMAKICPVVGVGYVLTNRNHQRIEDLIFQLQKANVSYLHVRPVVDHPELTCTEDVNYLKRFTYQQFPLLLDALSDNACAGNSGLPCVAHSVTTVISSSGNVFLCGRLNIHEWFEPMGNINTRSFRDIWRGPRRAEQAAQAVRPDFCRTHCPQCRITKFNKSLHRMTRIKSRNFI